MLGKLETQKSLSCSKYGDARENPTVTKMLLEAWSLGRLTWGNGRFLKEHPDIAQQRATDVEKLKDLARQQYKRLEARDRDSKQRLKTKT